MRRPRPSAWSFLRSVNSCEHLMWNDMEGRGRYGICQYFRHELIISSSKGHPLLPVTADARSSIARILLRYSTRDQNVRLAHVTIGGGKTAHVLLQTKDKPTYGLRQEATKYCRVQIMLNGMESMCLFMLPPPPSWSHFTCNGRTTHRFVPPTVCVCISCLTKEEPTDWWLLSCRRKLVGCTITLSFFFPLKHSDIYETALKVKCCPSSFNVALFLWLPVQVCDLRIYRLSNQAALANVTQLTKTVSVEAKECF
jgi:hypothetical protein